MTIRQHLTQLLADEMILAAVVHPETPYAGRFNWRRGDSVDALVGALAKARCLRKALAVACWATGAASVVRALAWPAQARSLRHAMYCEGALTPPARPTSDDRCREAAQKWGWTK